MQIVWVWCTCHRCSLKTWLLGKVPAETEENIEENAKPVNEDEFEEEANEDKQSEESKDVEEDEPVRQSESKGSETKVNEAEDSQGGLTMEEGNMREIKQEHNDDLNEDEDKEQDDGNLENINTQIQRLQTIFNDEMPKVLCRGVDIGMEIIC